MIMKILGINCNLNTPTISGWLDSPFEGKDITREDAIAERIIDEDPDAVVFIEFRKKGNRKRKVGTPPKESIIMDIMKAKGYEFELATNNKMENLIVTAIAFDSIKWSIVGKADKRRHDNLNANVTQKFCGRNWLAITLQNISTRETVKIVGVHVPSDLRRKTFWDAIYKEVESGKDENVVIIGDFNAFYPKDNMEVTWNDTKVTNNSNPENELDPIIEGSFWDAWELSHKSKAQHDLDRYTYYLWNKALERLMGHRLDYAFLSPSLKGKMVYAEHLHDVRMPNAKKERLTDHSAILIELDIGATNEDQKDNLRYP